MEKLGENRLKELRDNPNEIGHISHLEKIGHYINKVIRAVTFGLAGYEFSDKEAKEEALNNSFNTNYDDENKSLFGLIDNNTRFAQVVRKEIDKRRSSAVSIASDCIEFSDKEPEDELNDRFNSDHYQSNTRFAQVVKKERLIIREAAAAMSSFD